MRRFVIALMVISGITLIIFGSIESPTPTLRNVEVTGPYMHDGSMETLEEVIDFYAAAGRNIEEGDYAGDGRENPLKNIFIIGFEATDLEKQALLDFLKSLTDEEFLTNPAYSNPWETVEE